jgi:non-heme chloroperoxidase
MTILKRFSFFVVILGCALACSASVSEDLNDRDPGLEIQGPAPIRDEFVTTSDGARIHFRAAGRMTTVPAVIFLPGFTLTASLWDQQLRTFSPSRLAIAVDSRSQGESSIMFSGNTPERRATDLHELIASLHISKCVIVGWSQGGQDLAAYIAQYGTGSLAALVFVDSTVSFGAAEIETHKQFSKIMLSGYASMDADPARFTEGLTHYIFRKPHPELDMQHIIDEARKTPPSIQISMHVMDIFGVDRRPALRNIDRPTLVIASSESPLLDVQKEMADAIPGARWVVVKGAGHALFIDEPEEFTKQLTKLLNEVSQS